MIFFLYSDTYGNCTSKEYSYSLEGSNTNISQVLDFLVRCHNKTTSSISASNKFLCSLMPFSIYESLQIFAYLRRFSISSSRLHLFYLLFDKTFNTFRHLIPPCDRILCTPRQSFSDYDSFVIVSSKLLFLFEKQTVEFYSLLKRIHFDRIAFRRIGSKFFIDFIRDTSFLDDTVASFRLIRFPRIGSAITFTSSHHCLSIVVSKSFLTSKETETSTLFAVPSAENSL